MRHISKTLIVLFIAYFSAGLLIAEDENRNQKAKEYLEKDVCIETDDHLYNILEKSNPSGVINDLQTVLNMLKVKKE